MMKFPSKLSCLICLALGSAASSITAQDREIKVELPGGSFLEMVWIEPGVFQMGSPPTESGHWLDVMPTTEPNTSTTATLEEQHQVTIRKGYFIGKYEVTQLQWVNTMGTRPWVEKAPDRFRNLVREGTNIPATYISWDDAQAFIHNLNMLEADALYRLPTEAEWEYAARAGTETAWFFGDEGDDLVLYAWSLGETAAIGEIYPHTVGLKLPNPWNLFDIYGNVAEWVQDSMLANYHELYPIDPLGVADDLGLNPYRVVRGGSFYTPDPVAFRSAHRRSSPQQMGGFDIGFRLVRQSFPDKPTSIAPSSWGMVKKSRLKYSNNT